jgi:hypothetical protein
MKILFLFAVILITSVNLYSQEMEWFGPIAGVGYLNNSGKSTMKNGIHSAFGWHIELPYTSGDLTGYGEAGLTLLGIEQQKVYPNVWGYFGCRYKEIGIGMGPVVNSIGTGLGVNLYTNVFLEKLRIPIGFDFNFIGGSTRIQLFIGFNYK